VNDKLVNIASYQCKAGDVINLREKAKKQTAHPGALTIAAQVGFPDWVEVDDKKFSRCSEVGSGSRRRSCRTSTRAWSSSCIRSSGVLPQAAASG
jgi:ribosomal protein S4